MLLYMYQNTKGENMFKGSFIKLLIGVAILVVSYAFPFFLIPLGSYSYSEDGITLEYAFDWNGEYTTKLKVENSSTKTDAYYKIDDKAIYWSTNEDVKVSDITKLGKIKNIYTLEIGGEEFKNNWALGFTIIGYVFTAWGTLGFLLHGKKR